MLPSPAMQITVLSGLATCAPMAAGKPKPIVPRPPEVISVLGLLNGKNWAVHIWFCPTSVVIMASPLVSSAIFSMTYWGLIGPFLSCLYPIGCVLSHSAICASQAFLSFFHAPLSSFTSSFIFERTFFTSPTMGTSTLTFLLIDVGSMSTCIILALG